MPKIAALDSFDRAILTLVQADNRLTHEAIAARISLSPSAVRRRLQELRRNGVIEKDVAMLSRDRLGFTVIVGVRCAREDEDVYERFKESMRACPEVGQCYSVSGDHDFIVVAHMPDMPRYNAWLKRYIIGDPDLNRCDTHFAFETVKFETALDLEGYRTD
jgi:Lrp/AsnC family leucine-responsive transcriptional regulator